MTDLKIAFVFDESISKAEKKFYALLEMKQSILLMLDQDFVKLEQLKKQGSSYFKQRKSLFNYLKELHLINPRSEMLNYIAEGYCLILGFGVNQKYMFSEIRSDNEGSKMNDKRKMNLRKKSKTKKNSMSEQNIAELFSKNSCVVFISMVNKPGTIKQA